MSYTASTENFFVNLIPTQDLAFIECVPAPEDWFLFITDVKRSTLAIEKGRYKEVNIAGSLCILAIINSEYYCKIPFIFGGDGAMFLVPASTVRYFSDLMFSVREFTHNILQLELRVGIVSVETIYQAGKQLAVGKMAFGHGSNLAVFEGDAIEFSEYLVKSDDSTYLLSDQHQPRQKVNFNGFACPFSPIPSQQGNVMALIIKPFQMNWINISSELSELIGDEKDHHPLDAKVVSVDKTFNNISMNAAIALGKNRGFSFYLKWLKMRSHFNTLNLNLKAGNVTKTIENFIIPASDYRKYDGNFKIVFRCDTNTLNLVLDWLKSHEEKGDFWFGYHLTQSSLITCLFTGAGDDREIHLIDAADGGYALAAKMLKQKLKEWPENPSLVNQN